MKDCETCGAPIYPPGVFYTGVSCLFGGNHPKLTQSNLDSPIRELTEAVKELTKAITKAKPTKRSK